MNFSKASRISGSPKLNKNSTRHASIKFGKTSFKKFLMRNFFFYKHFLDRRGPRLLTKCWFWIFKPVRKKFLVSSIFTFTIREENLGNSDVAYSLTIFIRFFVRALIFTHHTSKDAERPGDSETVRISLIGLFSRHLQV